VRRPRQQRSEDTARFILEATDRVLVREGTAALTIKRVAQVAGVGVGTVYHHFPDRTALLREAEQRAWVAEFALLVGQVPELRPDTIDAAVTRLVAFAVESILRRIDSHGVTMDDPELRTVMFEMWDQTAELLTVALAPVAARLRRPDVTGSLRLATETLAMMAWVGALRHRARIESGELQRELGDMISRYLLSDPPSR
jgi:AcrR family transcriptional regulator